MAPLALGRGRGAHARVVVVPRLVGAGLWLVATVAATAMVWAATSLVAADVTDRPATVLAHHDVVSELESGTSAAETPPTTAARKAESPAPTVASPGRPRARGNPSPPAPAAPPAAAPQAPPPPTPAAAPVSPPDPPSGSTTPPAPERPSATYSTIGGVVRVACNGNFFIDLVSAIPANGYAVHVVAGGPANVEVHFLRSGQDVSVKAVCFGQPIRYYDDNPPRR